jgi:hypothetical protein
METTDTSRTINITATWTSTHVIDVPEGEDPAAVIDAINSGEFPYWLDFTSVGADLTSWDAS